LRRELAGGGVMADTVNVETLERDIAKLDGAR
jgi:hypothetical protein